MAEAVPVVDVMPSGSSSNILEALALSNGGGMGGGNNWWWIILLFLFIGGNGFGRNGGAETSQLVTDSAIATAKNEAGLNFLGQNAAAQGVKLDQIIASQYQANSALSQAICNLGYTDLQNFNALNSKVDACCCATQQAIAQLNYNMAMQGCEIKQAVAAEGCATRALIQANTLQETRDALADAKLKLALAEQNSGCC